MRTGPRRERGVVIDRPPDLPADALLDPLDYTSTRQPALQLLPTYFITRPQSSLATRLTQLMEANDAQPISDDFDERTNPCLDPDAGPGT